VQEQLGHSSIVLTAGTYISVLPEVARTAAEKVAALILRAAAWSPEQSGAGGATAGEGDAAHAPGRASHELIPAGRSAARGGLAAPVPADRSHRVRP